MNAIIPSRHRGFSLVELTVVIGIIAVLVAITLTVGSSLSRRANVQQTQNTIRVLDQAVSEWERISARTLTWGTDGTPTGAAYDLQQNTPHLYSLTEMLDVIGRVGEIRTYIAQIDQRSIHTFASSEAAPPWLTSLDPNEPDPFVGQWQAQYGSGQWNGSLAVLDAWDRPLRFVHGGRLGNPDPPFNDTMGALDADRTIRTQAESIYGIAVNRRPFVVSSGPDGFFGDASSGDAFVRQMVTDNIFSYVVGKP